MYRVNVELTLGNIILRKIYKKMVKEDVGRKNFLRKSGVYLREWADTLFAKVRTRRPPAANLRRASPVVARCSRTDKQVCGFAAGRSLGQVIYGKNGIVYGISLCNRRYITGFLGAATRH